MVCIAVAALCFAGFQTAWAQSEPSSTLPADFVGTWRIAAWVGESQGGFAGPDPRSLVGRTVRITRTEVQAPGRTCRLQDAEVAILPNSDIESNLWGGQRIRELRLPRSDIDRSFGAESTPVFQDKAFCITAVKIDRNHIIDALGTGAIYRLTRIGN